MKKSRYVVLGVNDLSVTHPELLKEWDFEKNDLLPTDFTYGTDTKVWWKCIYGHSWNVAIKHRTISKTGCPFCQHKSSRAEMALFFLFQYNFSSVEHHMKIEGVEFDIFIEDINLLIEYDGVYWHKNKREKDKNKDIIAKNNGCGFLRIYEYDKYYEDTFISLDKNICYVGKEVDQRYDLLCKIVSLYCYKNLHMKKIEVPDNISKKVFELLREEKNADSLAVRKPEVAKFWHPNKNGDITASQVVPYSEYNAWWLCENGHEYQLLVKYKTKGTGCPICRKKYKKNSLEMCYPELLKFWDYDRNDISPKEVTKRSAIKVWWKEDDMSYQIQVRSMVERYEKNKERLKK